MSEIGGNQGGHGRVWEAKHGHCETGPYPFFDEGILFAAFVPFFLFLFFYV